MKYTVILAMEVLAKDLDHADAIGQGAAEHLLDTFNYDRSVLAVTSLRPISAALGDGQLAPRSGRHAFEEACLANMEEEGLTRSDAQGVYDANRALADWLFATGVPGDAAALDILSQATP